jgi:hypothetical protein
MRRPCVVLGLWMLQRQTNRVVSKMASSVKLIALNRMWPILQGNSEYWAANGFVEVEEIDEMLLVSIGYVLATNKKPIGDMTDGELVDYVA